MADLSRPYRGVAHFGLWAEETADEYGRRDALAVLAEAVQASQDRDLRYDGELAATLDYLAERSGCRSGLIGRFRKAIYIEHPVTRRRELAAAYRALCAAVTGLA